MRTVRVMPGRMKANRPNNTAASPRRASAHQFLERTGSTGCPISVLAFVVMEYSFLRFLSSFALLLVALGQEEQVQERQECGQRRRYVGKGRRREDTACTDRLAARQDAVAGQEPVGAGGGIDLHGQRHHVERQDRREQYGRQLDKKGRPNEDAHEEQGQPHMAAKSNDREKPRPKLHRHVARRVLDRVPHLVGRHAHRRYGILAEVALREPYGLATRVVVVGELPSHRLYPNAREVVTVQDHARRLGTRQPARAHLLGVLLVRTPHPKRRGPGDDHPDDHQNYVTENAQRSFLLGKNLPCNAYILLHPYTNEGAESCFWNA